MEIMQELMDLTFFRSLDSKEQDSLFEKIKELEARGFIPTEQKYVAELEQSFINSTLAKMKQTIEAFAQKGLHKDNSTHQSKDKGAEQ